ncbi:hypothetical protein [Actinoallomurus sp. NPDC052274]|uniref:hypothetical protein n=1 Tax=Actinoallomurus sp. NPDC052274 TaxID=3155420 RepID=UPI00341AFC24
MRGVPARWTSLVAVATTTAAIADGPTAPTADAGRRATPARLSPVGLRQDQCVDAPLRPGADRPLQPGTSGRIEVHRADGTVADTIDLADPRSYHRAIGDAVSDTGVPHSFAYRPLLVDGNTATITLHHRLDYGRTYYVTVDPEAFPGLPACRTRRPGDSAPGPPRLVRGSGGSPSRRTGGATSARSRARSTSFRRETSGRW